MITRLVRLKEIGRFQDYAWDATLPDFGKVNLIFGYNGSGKTTLSNIFRLYSFQRDDPDDALFAGLSNNEDAIVTVQFNDRPIPYASTCERREIYVFNSDFVTEHVFEGATLTCKEFDTSVLTNEQLKSPRIAQLEKQFDAQRNEASQKRDQKQKLENRFAEIRKAVSREFNSRIRGSRSPSIEIPAAPPPGSPKLARQELNVAYDEYALTQKQVKLKEDLQELDSLRFEDIEVDTDIVEEILSRSIAEESRNKVQKRVDDLERFKPRSTTLSQWFEDGYRLLQHVHEERQATCPLCQSDLKGTMTSLLSDYQAFFSEEYSRLITKIDNLTEAVDEDIIRMAKNKEADSRLASHEKEYADFVGGPQLDANWGGELSKRNLEQIRRQLQQKKANLTQTSWQIDIATKELIQNYNRDLFRLAERRQNLVKALRAKFSDPTEVLNKIKALLVKCAHAEFNASGDGHQVEHYHSLVKDLQQTEEHSRRIEAQRNREIAKLRDESRYINRYLKRLGIHNFEIVMGRQERGDNICIQYGTGTARSKLKHSLSESEKTTLAFAYFLSKIEYEVMDNNRASMADTVVVIDDPVSSLDENRLHVTACLINELFRDTKQLFVLSHNVIFMKFLSNVLGKVTVQGIKGDKVNSRRDYYLCAHTGKLLKLPRQLRNYRTTYFQRVNELLQYSKGDILYEDAKAFLPNRIRTVLETFLSFKFCVLTQGSSGDKYRSPALDRLANMLKSKTHLFAEFDKVGVVDSKSLVPTIEEIKRITDPQAHGSPQDIDDVSFVSEQELQRITRNALDLMIFLDRIHFDELGSP